MEKSNSDNDFQYSRYAKAVESVLENIPVKNGRVSIHSIHLESSLPYDIIEELLESGKIDFPDKIKEITRD